VEKPKRSMVVRNAIGLIALVTVGAVGILEMRARSGAMQAVKKLEEAQDDLEKNRFAPGLSKERVQVILGRPPSGPVVKEGPYDKQMYVWKGVFRRYILNAYFLGDEPAKLESFGVE